MGVRARCLETSRVTVGSDPGGPSRHSKLTESRMRTPDCRQLGRASATRIRKLVPSDCQLAAPRPLFSWVTNFLNGCPSCSCRAPAPRLCWGTNLWSKARGGRVEEARGAGAGPGLLGPSCFRTPFCAVASSPVLVMPMPLRRTPEGGADGSESPRSYQVPRLDVAALVPPQGHHLFLKSLVLVEPEAAPFTPAWPPFRIRALPPGRSGESC